MKAKTLCVAQNSVVEELTKCSPIFTKGIVMQFTCTV